MKKMLLWILLPVLIFADGIRFDGEDDWVDFDGMIGAITSQDFTIDLWVNPHDMNQDDAADIIGDDVVGDKDCIIGFNHEEGSSSWNHYLIFIWNNNLIYHDGSSHTLASLSADDYDVWHHLAIVYDYDETGSTNGTITIWYDGVSSGFTSSYAPFGSILGDSYHLSLGQEYDGSNNRTDFFEGGMDEVRIWQKILSDAEIVALSDDSPEQATGSIVPNDYIARFTMDETTDASKIVSTTGTYEGMLYGPIRYSTTDVSLPVELSSFTAESNNGTVVLEWKTESEINNAGFNVYRSTDNEVYQQINGTLILGAINSSTSNTYSFTDTEVQANMKYYYKLEDISTAGESTLHDAINIIISEEVATATNFILGCAYPNPFNPSTTINFVIAENATVKINIYDMKGSMVNTLVNNEYSIGSYQATWNAVDFNNNPVSAGIYIYQMITSTGFTKSSKMILIK